MPFWDERVAAMMPEYPDVRVDRYHVDILTRTSSATRIGSMWSSRATCSGTSCRTWAPPAPGRSASPPRQTSTRHASPRRCSNRSTAAAPDIAGQGIANPIGQIWSAAMMLDFLGQAPGEEAARQDAHDAILRAIEHVCEHGPRTRDMGGAASTEEVGRAIAAALSATGSGKREPNINPAYQTVNWRAGKPSRRRQNELWSSPSSSIDSLWFPGGPMLR